MDAAGRPVDPNHPGMRDMYSSRLPNPGVSQEKRISTSSDDKPRELSRHSMGKDGRPGEHGHPGGSDRPPPRPPPSSGENPGKGKPDKVRQDPAIQQDASAIFAALFEKDPQKAKPGSGSQTSEAARPTLTAASLIDVIITRSINQPLLEAQDQGTDSDSNDFQPNNPNRPSGSQERPSHSGQEAELVSKDKEPVGMASSSTGIGSPNKPGANPMPARSEADSGNPGNGNKPTQSTNSGTPVKPRPITLAEHIDSIISLDYNHTVGSSTSKSGSKAQEGGPRGEGSAVDTTVRPQQEQGPTSTISATMRYQQKISQESEVGSTNDATSRRETSPLSNVHSSRSGSLEPRNRSRAGTPGSSDSPDTGNTDERQRDDKSGSLSSSRGSTSSTNSRQADTAGQSRSPGDIKPDSHSNGSGVNRWGVPQYDRTMVTASGGNPARFPTSEAGREASPVSHGDIPSWSRKYPYDSNKADSSESPSAGSLSRVHVHSSQSNSPQTSEGWGLDSSRPASLGRRRDSPETSTGLGSSSSMHPDASSSGISVESKKNYDSSVSSGLVDNKWRRGGMLADRSRPGMPEVESSRNSPIPQSSSLSADYQSKGSMQPADSMSQMRHRMGASSSSRSPVAGQSNALSSSSGMPQRGASRKDAIISLDLRKSIDRMIESQVRVDDPQRPRPTQVRVDDYVTQLFEADMSSSMSTPQRCDSRESTSTAESGSGLQIEENKISDVSDPDSRQEPVSEGQQTNKRSSQGGSPRQSSTETAETESPPRTPPVSASEATASSHGKSQDQRKVNAVSSATSRRPEEQGSQPSQSLLPSSSQQGFPSAQYPFSALGFPYASSTAPPMGHHLAPSQRNIPSPRGRGPSPAPGPGAPAGREGKETTQILSSQYETLSDSD